MSNYTKSTNFATKDNLTPGDPLKIVRGTEIDTEYNNIATAIATKTDNSSAAITGGTINATTIGATTASTGAFSTLSATGAITSTLATGTAPLVIASTTKVANLNVDSLDGADWASPAALGSTTPAAVSATTLTTSSTVTFNGGTANGVAYLNGSKVVTSGSALEFNGTNFGVGTGGNTLNHQSVVYKVGANAVYQQVANGSTGLGATNGVRIGVSSAGVGEWYSPTASISYIDNTEQMRLTSTGLGIGTSSPAAKLTVANSGTGIPIIRLSGFNDSNNSNYSVIQFYNEDASGQGPNIAASIKALTTSNSNGSGGQIAFSTSTGTGTAGVEASETMRLDGSGNLLVGTTTATGARIDVYNSGSGDATIRVGNAQNGFTNSFGKQGGTAYGSNAIGDGFVYSDSSLSIMADNGTGVIKFSSGGNSERARIDSSGNLLAGTTTASNTPSQGITLMQNSSVGSIGIGHANGTTAGNGYLNFAYNGSAIGSVTQDGTTAVLYNTTSDQRLKENIQDADSASSLIDSLQVRQFDWKSDGSHTRYGFVAQELVTVAPEAVHQPADTEEMMAVDYSKLVPMLVKEIQSLRKRLADAGI